MKHTFGSVEPWIEYGNWNPNGKYRAQPFSDVTMLCAYRIEQTLLYNNLRTSLGPNYKFGMLIIHIYIFMYKNARYRSQFNRSSWNSHGRSGSIHGWTLLFLETTGTIEPQIWGKMCPKTSFLGLSQTVRGVLRKKFEDSIRYIIFHTEGYILFVVRRSISSKMVTPPENNFSPVILENCSFFSKKLLN